MGGAVRWPGRACRWRFRGDKLAWIVEPAKERLECWEGHRMLRKWDKEDWRK